MPFKQKENTMEQRSTEWFAARKGRVTGSSVGAILGLSPFMSPDDVMRRMVRERNGAASEFKKWNKAAGKVLAGLTRRREAERQLFLSDANSISEPSPLPPDAPIIVAEPDYDPPKRFNIWPWVLGAVILAVLFVVTQVRF